MTQLTTPAPETSAGRRLLSALNGGQAKKLFGVSLFLVILYGFLLAADPAAASAVNQYNLARRIGEYSIISLGVGVLIIAGGIDLSIGSVVALSSALLAVLIHVYNPNDEKEKYGFGLSPFVAIPVVLLGGALIGLGYGLLVTRLRVQPFVATLCGLFVYRGIARWIAGDQQRGLGTSFREWKFWLAENDVVFGLPVFLVIALVLAVVLGVVLHFSVFGRYLFAIGSNERAARYAGIPTAAYKVAAYVICSALAAFFGVLYLMEQNSVTPSQAGQFFELYAIAGAVLGGCSLRGGEGTVVGILLGTSIVWLLPNLTNMWSIPSQLTDIVTGTALLLGAILDESIRRRQTVRAGE